MMIVDAERKAQLTKERDAVLLSMDQKRIRAFTRAWRRIELPKDPRAFWMVVHKARASTESLPFEERRRSARWLRQRGYKTSDHGNLP